MKLKYFLLFFTSILFSCHKKAVELSIYNNHIKNADSISFVVQNNTNTPYLFFIEEKSINFQQTINSFYVHIYNGKGVTESVSSISDPLFVIPDENGFIDEESFVTEQKYFECVNKDRSVSFILPPKDKILIKQKLIDSIDECGRSNYPILDKNLEYKLSLKISLDSSKLSEINKVKLNNLMKKKQLILYQGELSSNDIILSK